MRRAEHPHDVVFDRQEGMLRQRDGRIAADRAQPEVEREHGRDGGEQELERQARAHRLPRLASPPHTDLVPARADGAGLGPRQLEDERGAGSELRVDVQAAAHPAHELPRDVEAEARTARPRELRPGPVELVEDPRLLGG